MRDRPQAVGDVAEALALSQQITSHHLRVLREAGLVDETRDGVRHLFVVRSPQRDALQRHLQAHGVQAQVHYPVPPHRQPAYATLPNAELPLTERLHDEVLSLPLGPSSSDDAVERVIEACQAFECPP